MIYLLAFVLVVAEMFTLCEYLDVDHRPRRPTSIEAITKGHGPFLNATNARENGSRKR